MKWCLMLMEMKMIMKFTWSNLFVGGETTRHIFMADCVLCLISSIKNGLLERTGTNGEKDATANDGDMDDDDWCGDESDFDE